MILLGQYDSPVTRRVAVTLHLYSLPFTRDTRSVFGDAEGIASISPMVRIPALTLDDGEVLIDSTAILDHLDEKVGPARALIPRQGPRRRQILQATALAQACFEKAATLVFEHYFHPAAHVSPEWDARCRAQLAAGLAALEARAPSPWLCGDTLSHADVMLTCAVGYLRLRLPAAFPDGAFPRLARLARHCESLPAFAAAAISPEETMPAP